MEYVKSAKIGGNEADKELMEEIEKYRKKRGLKHNSEAVRELCQYALEVKKVGE